VLESVLRGVAPERLPTTASASSVAIRKAGYTFEQFLRVDPRERARLEYDTALAYGGDYLAGGFWGTLAVEALGGRIKFREHGSPDVCAPLIENIADIDRIDITAIRRHPYYRIALDTTKLLFGLGDGKFNNQVGSWGIFTQAGLYYGAEKLLRGCLRDKSAIRALLDFTLEAFKYSQEEFVGLGATVGGSADPTASGDMISRGVFEEFALPYLQKTYDWFKSKGLSTTLHICGDINDRIDLIPDTHTDILSVDYKVDIARAARILDGRVAIGGNADPASVILAQTPEAITAAYQKIIDDLEGYPYIVMPGCGIPHLTPIENIVAINRLAHSTRPAPYTTAGAGAA
jgi:uroporphyrinogen decarboxylase